MVQPRIIPPVTTDSIQDRQLGSWINRIWQSLNAMEGWQHKICPIYISGSCVNSPTWTQIGATSFFAYAMVGTGGDFKQLWSFYQIPHDFKFETPIYPFICWCPNTSGTGNVHWKLDYTSAKGHNQGVFNFAAPTSTTITTAAPAVQYQNMISVAATGVSGAEPNSIIPVRWERDPANASDTYAETAFFLTTGFFYQTEGRVTTTRSPAWKKFGTLGV